MASNRIGGIVIKLITIVVFLLASVICFAGPIYDNATIENSLKLQYITAGSALTISSDNSVMKIASPLANQIYAGPVSGASGDPTFRSLVAADLPATAVSAGSFGSATQVGVFTVDAAGRLTAASNVSISFPTSLPPSGAASGDLTGAYPAPTLTLTGVSAATYGSTTQAPVVAIDAKGRISSASNATISGTTPGGGAGGDLTGTYPAPVLVTSGVVSGDYGSASNVAEVVIDPKGRITSASNAPISIGASNVGGFTPQSIIFADAAGKLSEDNTGIIWNSASKRMTISGDVSVATSVVDSFAAASTFSVLSNTITSGDNTTVAVNAVATALVQAGAVNDKFLSGGQFVVQRGDGTDDGALDGMAGNFSQVIHASGVSGETTNVYGYLEFTNTQLGHIGTLYDFFGIRVPGSGTVDTHYGVYISNDSANPVKNYLSGSAQIGGTSYSASADATLSLKGVGALALNQVTTTEKNGLGAENGWIVYDTDLSSFQCYSGGSWGSCGTGGGPVASTSLDNLTATAINQNLLPNVDATLDLGSGALRWRRLAVADVVDASDLSAINIPNRQTYDNASVLAIDWQSRELRDAGGVMVMDWTGDLNFQGRLLTNVLDPASPQDAATKAYVDASVGAGGTVTHVGLIAPPILSVSGSPVTTSGDITLSLVSQNANLVFAGPATGVSTPPTFRSLVAADLPATAVSAGSYGSNVLIPTFTVDAAGRLTAASSVAVSGALGGTVTNVATGTGLSGGPITSTGTISLANTAVSANSYGSATSVPSFTVDAQGRLTAASNVAISGTTPGGGAGGDLTGTYPAPTLTTTGVSAATYGSTTQAPVIAIDVKGRITSASNSTISGTTPGGGAGGDLVGSYPAPTLAATSVSSGSYGSTTQVATFTVDTKGRLTAAGNATISVAPSGTASGDLTGTYPNPTIANLAVTNAKIANTTIDLTTKVTGVLPVANGGTSFATYASGDITYANSTTSLTKLTLGTDNQQLTVINSAPAWKADDWEAYTKNLGFTVSVASNILTVALKTKSLTDPSATNPVYIGFRNATSASGDYSVRTITGAVSVSIPSGTTIGAINNGSDRFSVYAIDNGGTIELAITTAGIFDEASVLSTTAISGGTNRGVLYSTTARSNVPVRLIGVFKAPQSTAGTWASAPTEVSGLPIDTGYIKSAGQNQLRLVTANISNAGTPTLDFESEPWVSSLTDNGAGDTTINIRTGVFGTDPVCTLVCRSSSGAARIAWVSSGTHSTTAIEAFCSNVAGVLQDNNFDITCIGK